MSVESSGDVGIDVTLATSKRRVVCAAGAGAVRRCLRSFRYGYAGLQLEPKFSSVRCGQLLFVAPTKWERARAYPRRLPTSNKRRSQEGDGWLQSDQ
jgi:hypothetical protein